MIMTAVWWGRYWYDTLTITVIIGFFLIEMLLLFRNTLIGWAMTAKCAVLSGVFLFVLANPPVVLEDENVTIQLVAIRAALITVLSAVIGILLYMRLRRLTVVIGREPCKPPDCP